MKFIKHNEVEYHLIDEEVLLGKGFIYESKASMLYEKPRINYFIELEVIDGNKEIVSTEIINRLVEVAKVMRTKFEDYNARVYHCCFADNVDTIELYKSIEGFNNDEGMHVLSHSLNVHSITRKLNKEYSLVINSLETRDVVLNLIEVHAKVFKSASYSVEDLDELKMKDNFQCVTLFKDDSIVANIIVFVDENKVGILEDLFVLEEERKNGLGRFLVEYANDFLFHSGVERIELEVWYPNMKAISLYNSCGYQFDRLSEVSIGMSI